MNIAIISFKYHCKRLLSGSVNNLTIDNMESADIKKVFNYLQSNQQPLTSYQLDFIKSLKKYFKKTGRLSPRQIECLVSIKSNTAEEVYQAISH